MGLTPLSQLSPDPLGTTGSSAIEFGFFPSMLPPVSPVTSVINATELHGNHHGNHHLELDNLVMPEAMPTYSITPPEPKRSRKPWQERDMGNISGSRTLETVVERLSLEVDDTAGNHSKSALLDLTSSSSESEKDAFIFPSATESPFNPRKQLAMGKNLGNNFDMFFGEPMIEKSFPLESDSSSSTRSQAKHKPHQNSAERDLLMPENLDKDITRDSRSMLHHGTNHEAESQKISGSNYPHTLFSPNHQSWKRPINKQDSLELMVTDDQLTVL